MEKSLTASSLSVEEENFSKRPTEKTPVKGFFQEMYETAARTGDWSHIRELKLPSTWGEYQRIQQEAADKYVMYLQEQEKLKKKKKKKSCIIC